MAGAGASGRASGDDPAVRGDATGDVPPTGHGCRRGVLWSTSSSGSTPNTSWAGRGGPALVSSLASDGSCWAAAQNGDVRVPSWVAAGSDADAGGDRGSAGEGTAAGVSGDAVGEGAVASGDAVGVRDGAAGDATAGDGSAASDGTAGVGEIDGDDVVGVRAGDGLAAGGEAAGGASAANPASGGDAVGAGDGSTTIDGLALVSPTSGLGVHASTCCAVTAGEGSGHSMPGSWAAVAEAGVGARCDPADDSGPAQPPRSWPVLRAASASRSLTATADTVRHGVAEAGENAAGEAVPVGPPSSSAGQGVLANDSWGHGGCWSWSASFIKAAIGPLRRSARISPRKTGGNAR